MTVLNIVYFYQKPKFNVTAVIRHPYIRQNLINTNQTLYVYIPTKRVIENLNPRGKNSLSSLIIRGLSETPRFI